MLQSSTVPIDLVYVRDLDGREPVSQAQELAQLRWRIKNAKQQEINETCPEFVEFHGLRS